MLGRLLPQRIDNTYRGYTAALWLFALVVLVKAAISLGSIFNGYQAASSADGIPLDTFPAAGVQTVLSLFALVGLSRLVLCALCVVALLRYRAMIPLLFTLLLLEQLGRRVVLQFLPIPRADASPGSAFNLVLLAAMIVGLALSLRSGPRAPAPEA